MDRNDPPRITAVPRFFWKKTARPGTAVDCYRSSFALEIRPDYLPFGRPNFTDQEIDAVSRVLRTGWVGMGPEVQAFESELASALQVPEVVLLQSCTAALHLCLTALEIGPDDEVICPSLTWCSTANAALYRGARVVFCDIDRESWCASPASIAAKLTPQTKAVVYVHFGGWAAEMQPILDVLPPSITLVEDAAHAFGADYPDGTTVGSSGRPTCFSFYANKNLSTADGGAVSVNDRVFAERLRVLRQHGQTADAWKRFANHSTVMTTPSLELGFKASYTDLQAALGRVQLQRFAVLQQTRREVAAYYQDRLRDIVPPLVWQRDSDAPQHALHLLSVLLPLEHLKISRDQFVWELRQRNIGATIHYAPLHQMPFYQRTLGQQSLPETEFVGQRILTLPISSSMTIADAAYVCDHFIDILHRFAQ